MVATFAGQMVSQEVESRPRARMDRTLLGFLLILRQSGVVREREGQRMMRGAIAAIPDQFGE